MSQVELSNTGKLPDPPSGRTPPHPVALFLNLFSSIWLGVWLLAFLFVYSTIGSVGLWLPGAMPVAYNHDWIHHIYWFIPWTQLHIRQAPGFEMTEFEWFHWWPFNLNIALICVNIIVATLRRIPFNVINLGVWMIHTGIITLAVGSMMYFGTKLEGDAPILRRQLVIEVPNHDPVSLAAQPGHRTVIETRDGEYAFEIMNIDPKWELLTGDYAGRQAYTVMVAVHSPRHQFVRTLPAGYPDQVQDAIFTGDPNQPLVRAINEIGTPIVDDSIQLSLEYAPQENFYLMESAAIYLREKGQTEWVQRPINGLPRYNDYLRSRTEVTYPRRMGAQDDEAPFRPRSLEIKVPAVDENDPLADVPLYVTRYLRYAFNETLRMPGGPHFDPAVSVRLRSLERGQVQEHTLVARDPTENTAQEGRLAFRWITAEEQLEQLLTTRQATMHISVPEADVEVEAPITGIGRDSDFTPIEGTDYSYRIEALQDGLTLQTGGEVSVAIVHIRTGDRTFQRWVFDDPMMPNRDLALGTAHSMHEQELELDENIRMLYRPGRRPSPVLLIGGPADDQLRLRLHIGPGEPTIRDVRPGDVVELQPGITLEIHTFSARTWTTTRPRVIPPEQRERDSRQLRSMVRLDVPIADGKSAWLQYHHFPFTDRTQALRRFLYLPHEMELPDGRVIELVYSRQRRPLPTPIALHEFKVTAHIGGFTGQTSSIRDWTSMVRFEQDGLWTDPEPISMNKPANYGGFWYFQAQWDPPDEPRGPGDVPSAGLNYTVLGVGNRNGVWTQLFGCIIAVTGMIYAFYVKPAIKRRRQQAVYASVRASANNEYDAHNGGGAVEERR